MTFRPGSVPMEPIEPAPLTSDPHPSDPSVTGSSRDGHGSVFGWKEERLKGRCVGTRGLKTGSRVIGSRRETSGPVTFRRNRLQSSGRDGSRKLTEICLVRGGVVSIGGRLSPTPE